MSAWDTLGSKDYMRFLGHGIKVKCPTFQSLQKFVMNASWANNTSRVH